MNSYKYRLEILSPIHIGTGDELDSFDYVIREGKYHRISFQRFFESLSQNELAEFDAIDPRRIESIREFIFNHADPAKCSLYSCSVEAGLETEYTRAMKRTDTRQVVFPTIRTGKEMSPLIPGSSLKGAIRTAMLDAIRLQNRPSMTKEEANELRNMLEPELLEYVDRESRWPRARIGNDPFRLLHVPDVTLPRDQAVLCKAVNVARREGEVLEKVPVIVEAVAPNTSPDAEDADIEIAVDDVEMKCLRRLPPTKRRFEKIEDIQGQCREFYLREAKDCAQFFRGTRFERGTQEILHAVSEDGVTPLRVGKFSGARSVTLTGLLFKEPKTRFISSQGYPIGWLRLVRK